MFDDVTIYDVTEASVNRLSGCFAEMSDLASKLVKLALNWTNLGLIKISLSTFWLGDPKDTETDLKKSQIYHIWGQLTQF